MKVYLDIADGSKDEMGKVAHMLCDMGAAGYKTCIYRYKGPSDEDVFYFAKKTKTGYSISIERTGNA